MSRALRPRRRARFRHRVEYGALRAVFGTLARLPAPIGDAAAAALGRFVFAVLRIRRGVVESQIAAAYPHAPPAWVRRLARDAYVHFARELVAIVAFARAWPEGLSRCVEYRGLEGLREAARAGGAIIVTGHFGNWELSGSSLAAAGIPMYGVFQPQSNAPVDAYVRRVREALGIRLVRRGRVAHSARAIFGRGGVLGFVADQDARARGLFVPFFGRPASTHRGPALLARMLGVPLFVGVLRRVGPGRRYRVEIERIPRARRESASASAAGTEGDVRELTARWVARLEGLIRVSPEQYFWHHRRWKSQPPGTQAADAGTISEQRPRSPEAQSA